MKIYNSPERRDAFGECVFVKYKKLVFLRVINKICLCYTDAVMCFVTVYIFISTATTTTKIFLRNAFFCILFYRRCIINCLFNFIKKIIKVSLFYK